MDFSVRLQLPLIRSDAPEKAKSTRKVNVGVSIVAGPDGNTGTLYIVESEEVIDRVLNQGMIPLYVPIIDQDHFSNMWCG
eukprot:m.183783 g.183783  ORF g.183783 m.183783 type:complete len:80 (+) comp39313_c0_seq44:136-375(+)